MRRKLQDTINDLLMKAEYETQTQTRSHQLHCGTDDCGMENVDLGTSRAVGSDAMMWNVW